MTTNFMGTLFDELRKVTTVGLGVASAVSAPKPKRSKTGAAEDNSLESCTPCALAAKRAEVSKQLAQYKKDWGTK